MVTDDVSLPMAMLAVISDIHGDVWTLDAVLGDIVRRSVLFTHEVVVQARAIDDLLDDLAHVDLSGDLGSLEEYRP